jgi:hypothetical protein
MSADAIHGGIAGAGFMSLICLLYASAQRERAYWRGFIEGATEVRSAAFGVLRAAGVKDSLFAAVASATYAVLRAASGMSAGTAETQSGSGLQPASPTSQSEGTPNPNPGPPGVRS